MNIQLEQGDATYRIESYQSGTSIRISATDYQHSLIVMPEHLQAWSPDNFDVLQAEHFQELATLQPELVLFGAGVAFRYPAAALLAPLINQGIGVEVMTTAAACRTYGILIADGRRVAAALLLQ